MNINGTRLSPLIAQPIRTKRVSEIDTDDVLKVLTPIWQSKNETASRLRGRIERVLDFAKVKGWRTGENPALWRGHLRNILPKRQKLQRGHLAAMPYEDVPAFVERLRKTEAMAARALEFAILTVARSGEVLGATLAGDRLRPQALDSAETSDEGGRTAHGAALRCGPGRAQAAA